MHDQNVKPSKALKKINGWTRSRADFDYEVEVQRIQTWKASRPDNFTGRSIHIRIDNIKRCRGNLYEALILSQFDYWDDSLFDHIFAWKDPMGVTWWNVPMGYWTKECGLEESVAEHSINHLIEIGMLHVRDIKGHQMLRPDHLGIFDDDEPAVE